MSGPESIAIIVNGEDRTCSVPNHQGPNVLPNSPLFSRILRLAHQSKRIAIKDPTAGFAASYIQLLTDVLHLRNHLEKSPDYSILEHLERVEEVFMTILGEGGYEFTVAFFAIMAVGAVVVPLSPSLSLEELGNRVKRCRSIATLTTSTHAALGRELEEYIAISSTSTFRSIDIGPHINRPPLLPREIVISSDLQLDSNGSAFVIFTSGTTGQPKGVVKRRAAVYNAALAVADNYQLGENDTVLHITPVDHASGIGLALLPFLLSGGCVEFQIECSQAFDAGRLWERWREGGLTFFSGVPNIYNSMMVYFEKHISILPAEQLKGYIAGANKFRGMLCGTSALPQQLQQKWTELRGGRMLLTRYGGTESSAVFKVPLHTADVPEGSVGETVPGVDVKLSGGDEGEVFIKSPNMFSRYLFDPEATANAHDKYGYFKTGDVARREGKYYFILGRADVDIIKSGGHTIYTLDIEKEILGFDYVSEVMVVGVENGELGQRVAAAVVLTVNTTSLTLANLRKDLSPILPDYKLPTYLRIVGERELRKTVMGKVLKKALAGELFPPHGHSDIQIWKS